MAQIFVSPFAQYTDASGNPGSGDKLYFYQTGTTTALTIYSDIGLTTPQANPVIADSAGQWPAVYLAEQLYKVVMKSAADVTIRTADPAGGDGTTGPASSTDNAVVRWDGASGKKLQSSVVVIDDTGNVSGVVALTTSGAITAGGAVLPSANDGAALGASATAWSDLFLASGGVINWNAGNYTLTHTAGILTANGLLRASNGSASAPNYSYASALTTGTYRTAADNGIGFSIVGVSKGAFHSTGFSVVLGSSPDQLIDPDGTIVGGSISTVGSYASYVTTGINLHVGRNGDGNVANFKRAGVSVGTISISAGATAYNTSSDKDLKANWRPFDSGAIIDRLDVWHFDWKAGGTGYGVLAQDAHEVFPNAVTPPDDDVPTWSVDYSKYVALLLAEIKDLRRRLAKAGL